MSHSFILKMEKRNSFVISITCKVMEKAREILEILVMCFELEEKAGEGVMISENVE